MLASFYTCPHGTLANGFMSDVSHSCFVRLSAHVLPPLVCRGRLLGSKLQSSEFDARIGVSALWRLVEPTCGEGGNAGGAISIDGVDISTLELSALRSRLAIIVQVYNVQSPIPCVASSPFEKYLKDLPKLCFWMSDPYVSESP